MIKQAISAILLAAFVSGCSIPDLSQLDLGDCTQECADETDQCLTEANGCFADFDCSGDQAECLDLVVDCQEQAVKNAQEAASVLVMNSKVSISGQEPVDFEEAFALALQQELLACELVQNDCAVEKSECDSAAQGCFLQKEECLLEAQSCLSSCAADVEDVLQGE